MAIVAMVPVTRRNKGPSIHGAYRNRYPLINGKAHGVVTHDPTLMDKPVSRICGDCDAKHSDRNENAEKCFHTNEGVLLLGVRRACTRRLFSPGNCIFQMIVHGGKNITADV